MLIPTSSVTSTNTDKQSHNASAVVIAHFWVVRTEVAGDTNFFIKLAAGQRDVESTCERELG